MDSFDQQKKSTLEALYKPDKSKKGNVDEPIKGLLDTINNHDDYYTTSSCSGRIMVIAQSDDPKDKSKADWLFVSHNKAELEPILDSIANLPSQDVWFRLEGMILHVCVRDFAAANKFLIFAQNNGFKHTGILTANKRFIIQVMGVQRFDALIAKDGKLLVNEEYLQELLAIANKKLEITHQSINQLEVKFKKEF